MSGDFESPMLFETEAFSVRAHDEAPYLLDRLYLRVGRGEILTVIGREGAGGGALEAVLSDSLPRAFQKHGTFRRGVMDGGRPARIVCWPGPVGTLAPHASVAGQLARALARKQKIPIGSAREELKIVLKRFSKAPTLERLRARTSQLSPLEVAAGLLALALAQHPDAVIAEDAARGLDPRETEALIALLRREQARSHFALIFVTGDPDIAMRLGERALVLRDGRLVEEGPVEKLSTAYAHAYTQALFRAVPRLDMTAGPKQAPRSEPIIQVRGFSFNRMKRLDPAKAITFDLRRGAGLAFVGERGSGRRSLARAVLGLAPLRQGRIVFDAVDIGTLSSTMRAHLRRRVAYVTGEDDVLDPRMSVRDTVAEPLRAHLNLGAKQTESTMSTALHRVGLGDIRRELKPADLDTLGRRRLQVARAIAATPSLIVLYEPLVGLDAVATSLMLDLLRDYRARDGVACLLVTANFAVAQALADEVLVIKSRAVVERGLVGDVVREPKDSYTKALIAAVTPARVRALPPAQAAG